MTTAAQMGLGFMQMWNSEGGKVEPGGIPGIKAQGDWMICQQHFWDTREAHWTNLEVLEESLLGGVLCREK